MTSAVAHRRNLASGLVAGGTVRSRWLRRAFEETPREMFVPRFYRSESGREVLLDGTDPQQQEWLRGVYTDAALTGQLTPAPDLAHGAGAPTSSSSMPTVMAGMLEALDLQTGHRVLEIGTGTGYNTALLCHRVGADNVTSVELDPRLADAALQALTAVGLTLAVHTGDGLRCFLAYPAGPASACCARLGGRVRAGRTSRRWWSLRATAANRLAAWSGTRFQPARSRSLVQAATRPL